MRKLLALWLLALLFASPALAQPRDGQLTVAAYNIENFFDVFDDPYTGDEDNQVKPREGVEAVAKAIRAVNADVMAFEELENEGVLRAMVQEFLGDMGYEYIAVNRSNSDRGINLGVISRKPIVSLTSHRFQQLKVEGDPGTWSFARDLWKVRVQATPARTMDLYVVHLKSRHDSPGDPKSERWRYAEAVGAHRIIGQQLKADPKAWVVMLGDFNDTPETKSIKLLTSLLKDPHASLPAEARITYLHEPYRTPIDYTLVSPALFERVVPGSGKVLHDEALNKGSDHAPVSVTFRVND
jgi:predicted extracellular nuclease